MKNPEGKSIIVNDHEEILFHDGNDIEESVATSRALPGHSRRGFLSLSAASAVALVAGTGWICSPRGWRLHREAPKSDLSRSTFRKRRSMIFAIASKPRVGLPKRR
ncbi:twin-arginine translocation signal domain-containing protein [Mesorhizobium sp.]|uniref:twin-arginine translocation signal domain-containing protein n=1 Tax=Mesorhizobium sp. TaxID=1871066 RepID=UPI003BA94102